MSTGTIKSGGATVYLYTYTFVATSLSIAANTSVTVLDKKNGYTKIKTNNPINLGNYKYLKTKKQIRQYSIPSGGTVPTEPTGTVAENQKYIYNGGSGYSGPVVLGGISFYKVGNNAYIYVDEVTQVTQDSEVWVLDNKITITETPTPISTMYVTNANGAKVYGARSTNSEVFYTFPYNSGPYSILDVQPDIITGKPMSKITYLGNTYWILSGDLADSKSTTEGNIPTQDVTPQSTSTDDSEYAVDWNQLYTDYQIEISNSQVLTDEEYYRKLTSRSFNALGYPPKYNMDVDVQYTGHDADKVDMAPGIGRVYGKTIMANPAILSICPGKVEMFPHLMGLKRDNWGDKMADLASGNSSLIEKIKNDDPSKFTGKMYSFEADTKTYGYYVNALCRACAILMNVGDVVVPDMGTKKLKNFDYAYWSIRTLNKKQVDGNSEDSRDGSIFRNFFSDAIQNATQIINSLVEDSTWINFFLSGSETNVSEQINTEVTESPLSSIVSQVNDFGSQINYFTGSGFTVGVDTVAEQMKEALGGLYGIADMGKNILKGGKIVLPKMINNASYGKSIMCSTKFISPYGSPIAVFLKCVVPICHLLALALPKQLSDNMYGYPFVIAASQRGQFNVDLGVITELSINRGGNDNTSWTLESLPTEWEVSFSIQPLIDDLMITGTNHPVLFTNNENLLNYLGNMCGFDLLANNWRYKIELTESFFKNKITGYPRALGNALVDKLSTKLTNLTKVAWG